MADIKFYLEKRKDKQTGELITTNVPILLFFSFHGQRLQYFTGDRIDADKWDSTQQKVKRNYSETSEINNHLTSLKAKVNELYDKAKALEMPMSVQYFRDGLNDKPVIKKHNAFAEAFEEYYEVSKLSKTGSTLRNIKSAFNIFKEFSKVSGIRLEFDNIDQDFYNRFLEYCYTVKDLKNAYVGSLIRNLKSFLSYATEKDYNTNLAFRKKTFKRLFEEPEIIFLNYEELILFYNTELENPLLQEAKDVFCFGCFTGMRYSDIKALSPEQIHKDFIAYRVVKTSENNNIPLNPYSRAILKKYEGNPMRCLPIPSEFKVGERLKKAAKIAKLNRSILQNHYQGAKRITTKRPLHEAITFHVSKKTFMTNFLTKGGSLITAMAITGNKDMKTARRYFKVVDSLKANEMAKVFG
jgi:integrase